jgi:VIT1/CCC1 family predicted Fe2+/Mn2+ transporter
MNENSSYNPVQPPNPAAEAEEIRRRHLKHEASVKSIGILYFIGAVFIILAGFGAVLDKETPPEVRILAAALLTGLGLFQFWVGTGLRSLKSWARIPTGILSGIGLIGFPIGTIVNAYILYLVFCKKGSTVFSPEYQQVIAATPHIKYKTSIIIWILLAILLALFIFGLLAALLSKQ